MVLRNIFVVGSALLISPAELCGGEPGIPRNADAAQLLRCQNACSSGGSAIRGFCNTLPEPRIRNGCFALEMGSEAACKGWCYWHFGT